MLTLSTTVYFGKNDRFKAYQFDNEEFHKRWIEDGNKPLKDYNKRKTIFVRDTEQLDELGLPLVVFQEWIQNIDNLDQVIEIVRKRYPDAFDNDNTVFIAPYRDRDKE